MNEKKKKKLKFMICDNISSNPLSIGLTNFFFISFQIFEMRMKTTLKLLYFTNIIECVGFYLK